MGEPIFRDKNIPYNIYEPFNKDLDINEESLTFQEESRFHYTITNFFGAEFCPNVLKSG